MSMGGEPAAMIGAPPLSFPQSHPHGTCPLIGHDCATLKRVRARAIRSAKTDDSARANGNLAAAIFAARSS